MTALADLGAWTVPVTRGVVRSRPCCVCDTPRTTAIVYVRRAGPHRDPRFNSRQWVADVCSDECAVVSVIKRGIKECTS